MTPPKITKAENSAAGKVKLTWKAYENASKYIVYRSTSKTGTYTKVGTVAGMKRTYTDSGLTKGKTYYYKVKTQTVNRAGNTVTSAFGAVKESKVTQ